MINRNNWNGPRKEDPKTWPLWLRVLARAILDIAGQIKIVQVESSTPIGSGKTFEYDASGSISTWHDFMQGAEYSTSTLTNNDDSRLASFSSTTLNFGEYIYDHLGQRMIKNELGTTVFIYDIFGNLISEYGPDGTLIHDYVYLGGRRIAMIRNDQQGGGGFPGCGYTPPQGGICGINGLGQGVALNYAMMVVCPFLIWAGYRYRKNKIAVACIVITGLGIIVIMATQEAKSQPSPQESIFYYHGDHLGTPQAMTDSAGTVVWDAVYQPFGDLENVYSTQNVTNNFRFPGQYEDEMTGMYYNHHRYYMPELGRYNRVDPILFSNSQYLYVDDNPIKKIDPQGLVACTWSFINSLLPKYDEAYNQWQALMQLSWGPWNAYITHCGDTSAGSTHIPVWCFQYSQNLVNYLNGHVPSRGCCKADLKHISADHTITKVTCRNCGIEYEMKNYDPWYGTWFYYIFVAD